MSLASWPGHLAYLAVFIATIVEGEIVFVAASALVGLGQLNALGVFVAAALGGSAGDQLYFYAARGRLRHWLAHFPRLEQKQERVAAFVRKNATGMILACRFLPGLRVAIPMACAHAGVSSLRFSSFSLLSSVAWAGLVLLLVGHFGPASLYYLGVNVWWAPVVPAILVLAFFWWAGRKEEPILRIFQADK